ncbi:MAG: hypothetical protein A4E66_02633 [Syntrophus sp. PtaB.Bin001]|jgi:hypothetical protein|nr:MAG: hypothetical protein A4E66_02633 [Syntrophus sp. PtaB.Bin001]
MDFKGVAAKFQFEEKDLAATYNKNQERDIR